jgi:pSer/pThr/pTyr-binding forkhead associated (FHA) protein
MLFAPPLPPVRLAPGTPCVIGRSRDCGLPLASQDASRRHAAVTFDGARSVVSDLGSTNGTFVNGEPLAGPRELRPGDRIEIGSSVITFCEVDERFDAALGEPAEAQTVLFQRAPLADAEALQGDLSEIPPFAVLQLLEMGGKTGLLEIVSDAGPAQLWLERGQPVHALAAKQVGFDAALAIAQTSAGRFRFDASRSAPERTIEARVTELLLEASRLFDEENR